MVGAVFLSAFALVVLWGATEGDQLSCSSDLFRCLNGRCIRRSWFCDNADDCEDNSDERFCDINSQSPPVCVIGYNSWMLCENRRRCIPSVWKCDGVTDCPDGSDEASCESGIRAISGAVSAERNLTHHFLAMRSDTRSINKWGPHITRTAMALFLRDSNFFSPNNSTGEEIAYELSLQLMAKLALKKKMSTQELSLFINALIVACINPRDFFGVDMVAELRQRVDSNNNTNPYAILTLCNANDLMTGDDVIRLQEKFTAHRRPLWTDTQAIVTMAMACLAKDPGIIFSEELLNDMVIELKEKQRKNGTIDNLKTTALVMQALIATDTYRKDFDWSAAVKYIVREMNLTYASYQELYYILPIFRSKSLVNISSDHCTSPIKTDIEVIRHLREYPAERIQIQVSIYVGDEMDFIRTWKIKVPSNYTFYQVLENIGSLEPRYRVQYSVSNKKPYVVGLNNFQDNAEDEMFWFIYSKPVASTEKPKLIEKSPVDIKVKETDEIILWYRSGFWTSPQEDASVTTVTPIPQMEHTIPVL